MDCDKLAADVGSWLEGAAAALANERFDSAARQTAYAQNAINLQSENGCS